MSASQFARLYRELRFTDPNKKPHDITYERDREDVLHRLGHNCGRAFPNAVKGHQYHGVVARHRRDTHQLNVTRSGATKQALEQKKKILETTREADRVSAVTAEMQKYLQTSGSIPSKLLVELAAFPGEPCPRLQRTGSNAILRSNSSKNILKGGPDSSSKGKSLKQPAPVFNVISRNGRTMCRSTEPRYCQSSNRNSIDVNYTERKWTAEERERINKLFLDMPTPSNSSSKELWKLYLEALALRFVEFYPQRKVDEVIEKAREMIALRKLHYSGESDYWKNQTISTKM